MQALIILTQMRSGSSWLGNMLENTKVAGSPREWLNEQILKTGATGEDIHFNKIIEAGQSENGFFSVKIFPQHLRIVHKKYGYDFIQKCMNTFDTKFLFLERRDRLRQAISAMRATQSSEWSRGKLFRKERGEELYKFSTICKYIYYLEESNSFWKAYSYCRQIDSMNTTYEDILDNRRQFMKTLLDYLNLSDRVGVLDSLNSTITEKIQFKVQRDKITEDWVERFIADSKTKDAIEGAIVGEVFPRNIRNILRLLQGKPLRRNMFHPKLHFDQIEVAPFDKGAPV